MAYCTFEVYEDDTGEYRWRFESGSEVVAHSGEGYDSEREARAAVDLLREEAPDARISGDEAPYFELSEDQNGDWHWRLAASDGRAVTGRPVASRHGAKSITRTIQTSAGRAEVTVG